MHCQIDEQLQAMGIPPQFDHDGLFSFVLQRDGGGAVTATLHKDEPNRKLRLAVQSQSSLGKNMSPEFIQELARQSLEPLRDGYGIGLFPDSDRLTVYKVLELDTDTPLRTVLHTLLSHTEHWERLLQVTPPTSPAGESGRAHSHQLA